MTKKFFLALCLFILGTFISACGGGGKATPPSYPFIPVPTPAKYPIELSQTEFTVNIGETDNITVTLNGEDITQTATYTVDQEAIATVEAGLITGISVGIATVTVNAENAEADKTFTVNVIDPTLPTLEVSPTEINLGIEEEATVKVTLNGEDVTEQVTYTSDKELIATAEKGKVKAGIQAGIENNPLATKITVSLEGANSASFTVNVTDDSDNEVALNDDVLDQLYELGIIAKSSADKTELTEANIPAIFKYNGTKHKITSIAEAIFRECTLLENATIPNSVETIGSAAFDKCSSLKEIIIPDSVTSIGNASFRFCNSLETVTIGNSVEIINGGAFSGCSSLKEIVIPDSVTRIDGGAFGGCSSLETLTIGDGLTEIASGAFSNLSSLKKLTIGKNVKTIKSGALNGCSSLQELVIPDNVTTIESGNFGASNSLETLTIGDGLTEIFGALFINHTSLKTVTIGKGVKTIGEDAFKNCTSLESITIPNSVTSIGQEAFYNCGYNDDTAHLTLEVPDSVTSIGENAFYNLAEITYTSEMTATGSPWGAKKVNGVEQ